MYSPLLFSILVALVQWQLAMGSLLSARLPSFRAHLIPSATRNPVVTIVIQTQVSSLWSLPLPQLQLPITSTLKVLPVFLHPVPRSSLACSLNPSPSVTSPGCASPFSSVLPVLFLNQARC